MSSGPQWCAEQDEIEAQERQKKRNYERALKIKSMEPEEMKNLLSTFDKLKKSIEALKADQLSMPLHDHALLQEIKVLIRKLP
jgi:hypothetical protein